MNVRLRDDTTFEGYADRVKIQTGQGPARSSQRSRRKPRVFDGINPAAAALASGDIALLANASETGTYPLWTAGAPIRWDLPDPAVGAVTAQAIAATAPRPNAARLFYEYTFSLEGYTLFQKYQGVPAWIGMADQRTQLSPSGWYHIPDQFYPYGIKHANG